MQQEQQEAFDPYRKWLGISPKDQPPNLYRLLGIDLYESDPDVITNATDQRMSHVRTFQAGPHSSLSQRLLNELSTAKLRLLDPQKRADYDNELKQQLNGGGEAAPAAAPAPKRAAAPAGAKPSTSGVLSSRQTSAGQAIAGQAIAGQEAAENGEPSGTNGNSSSIIRRSSQVVPTRPRPALPPTKGAKPAAASTATEAAPLGAMADDSGITELIGDRAAGNRPVPPRPAQQPVRTKGAKSVLTSPATIATCGAGALVIGLIIWMATHGNAPPPVAEQAPAPAVVPPAPVPPKVPDKVVEKPKPVMPKHPRLAELPAQTAMQGQNVVLRMPTQGGMVGHGYRFEMRGAPAGATIDADSGMLQWQPGLEIAPGDYPFTVRLVRRDSGEEVSRQQLNIHLLPGLGKTDGHGIRADLYADDALLQARGARIDKRIDGYWVDTPPQAGLAVDNFSVRWAGWIKAPQPGTYTLSLLGSGGGAKMWLDGKLVIDSPAHQPRWRLTSVATLDDKPHSLNIEYRHSSPAAVLGLQWLRPDGIEEIVPAASLFHDVQVAEAATLSTPPAAALATNAGLQAELFRDDAFKDKMSSISTHSLNWVWGIRKGLRGQTKAVRFSGTLTAPEPGDYHFSVVHDGRVRLFIGDAAVIDAWQSDGLVRHTGDVKLAATQPIRIEFAYEGSESTALSVRWRPPHAEEEELLPSSALSFEVETPVKRLAPPPQDNVAKAITELKQEFAADYAAPDHDKQLALAEKLRLAATNRTVEPLRRYALLSEARDLSAGQNDLDAAWKAIDLMQRYFDVNPVAVRAEALVIATAASKDQESARTLAESYLALLQMAYRSGQFLQGSELIAPAVAAATHSKDRELRIAVNALGKQLRELSTEETRADAARATLAANANDAPAKYVLGRFLSLFRDNWEEGLPLLAAGANVSFKNAATSDARNPMASNHRKAIGDLWWEVQKSESGLAKERARLRAKKWYDLAREGRLDSNDLAQVEQRLEEIERDVPAVSPRDTATAEPVPPRGTKAEPLDNESARKLARLVLDNKGRVRVKGNDYWFEDSNSFPSDGEVVITGIKLENDAADDAALRFMGRLPALEELVLDSRNIGDNGIRGLQDLTQLRTLQIAATRVTDKGLSTLTRLTSLESLSLRGEQMGGGLAWLKQLPKLRELTIDGEKISDSTLANVAQVTGLEELTLNHGHYTAPSLEQLKALTNLRTLRLRSNSVTDAAIARLPDFKQLNNLTLEGNVGRAGFAALTKYSLQSLSIFSGALSEADLNPLGEMTGLTQLTLKIRPITDLGMDKFSKVSALRTLDLQATTVTDAGLASLRPLNNLTSVNLTGARFSRDAYHKFRSSHNDAQLTPRPDWGNWNNFNGKGPPFGRNPR